MGHLKNVYSLNEYNAEAGRRRDAEEMLDHLCVSPSPRLCVNHLASHEVLT